MNNRTAPPTFHDAYDDSPPGHLYIDEYRRHHGKSAHQRGGVGLPRHRFEHPAPVACSSGSSQSAIKDLTMRVGESMLPPAPGDTPADDLGTGRRRSGNGQKLSPKACVSRLALQHAVDDDVALRTVKAIRIGKNAHLRRLLLHGRVLLGRDTPGPGHVPEIFQRTARGRGIPIDESDRFVILKNRVIGSDVVVAHHRNSGLPIRSRELRRA